MGNTFHEPAIEWWAGMVECRVCTHRHAQVMPVEVGSDDPESTECPNCGSMACDPVEGER